MQDHDPTHPESAAPVTHEWLFEQVLSALPEDHGLAPLPRLNTDVTGRGAFRKVYFGVRCGCATSAVLSAEVSAGKTRNDVMAALPALVAGLLGQRDAFRRMPCAAHRNLRTRMPAAAQPDQGENRVRKGKDAET